MRRFLLLCLVVSFEYFYLQCVIFLLFHFIDDDFCAI